MSKEITYSDNERAIVAALKGAQDGMTLAEIKEATGLDIKPGHIVSAMRKGLLAASGERETLRPTIRQVSTYVYVTSNVLTNDKDKEYNYTDGEKAVLAAAASMDGEFTLAELAVAMNRDKLSSGSINGLVKKGNIAKGEGREVEGTAKASVKVYSFVRDIPDAE